MLSDLQFHMNRLTSYLPTEIGMLTNLLHISANDNFFTGTIPSEIRFLTKLIDLRLYDNFLSGLVSVFYFVTC